MERAKSVVADATAGMATIAAVTEPRHLQGRAICGRTRTSVNVELARRRLAAGRLAVAALCGAAIVLQGPHLASAARSLSDVEVQASASSRSHLFVTSVTGESRLPCANGHARGSIHCFSRTAK